MPVIDASALTDDTLKSYDDMMVECLGKVEKIAPLAASIWFEILRELDLRGMVKLVSGSYDDIPRARIRRNWGPIAPATDSE